MKMPSWAELQSRHPSPSSPEASWSLSWLAQVPLGSGHGHHLTPHPTQPELEAWVHMSTDR